MIVQTESSVYILDPSIRRLRRYPRDTPDPGAVFANLRMDGDAIPYALGGELAVGQPAVFMLMIRDDGVMTVRTTTPVVAITP